MREPLKAAFDLNPGVYLGLGGLGEGLAFPNACMFGCFLWGKVNS